MLIYIGLGAFIAAVVLDGIEYSFLGAFLGFIFLKLKQLNLQLSEIRSTLNQLQFKQQDNQPYSENEQVKSEEKYRSIDSAAKQAEIKPLPIEIKTTPNQSDQSAEAGDTSRPIDIKKEIPTSSQKNKPQVNSQQTDSKEATQMIGKLFNWVIDYFSRGNLVVKLGVVILFFGVAFLLKFTLERVELSMQIRLIAVTFFALAMLIIGWIYRNKNHGYGLSLQGLGIGLLYMALFVSFRLYHLLPASGVLLFLIVFSFLALALAVIQESRWLAILSISGGFLAPVLTSTGGGSHAALFSYYLILNIAIFAVAWLRSWRLLNLIGFIFTFLIGAAWGLKNYQVDDYYSTQAFLIAFFVLYSCISILFSRNQPPNLKGYVDGTLVFGLPVVAFTLQVQLVETYSYGLAWSAISLGIFYFSLSLWIKRSQESPFQLLAEAFSALALIFTSLVIPFVFDSEWTAASWAMEGAGLIWIGVKQRRWFAKYLGILVQLLGGVIFLSDMEGYPNPQQFLDAQLMGIIFVASGALFSAYQFLMNSNYHLTIENYFPRAFLILGLLWWYLGWTFVIVRYFEATHEMRNLVLFFSASGIGFFILERRYQWPDVAQVGWVSLGLFSLVTLQEVISQAHLNGWQNKLVWLIYFVSFYGILNRRENTPVTAADSNLISTRMPLANGYLHLAIGLLLIYVSGNEFEWLLREHSLLGTSWGIASIGLMLAACLMLVSKLKIWPMVSQPEVYHSWFNALLLFMAVVWVFFENFAHSGVVSFMPYIPLLNPLDVALGLLLWIAIRGIKLFFSANSALKLVHGHFILGGFIFIWLNIMLLRALSSWVGEAYRIHNWLQSVLVQTSISIFWTLLAMSITIYATRKSKRELWFIGTGLIGVTVVKLFTIDLGNSSSVERIVSFIVVGLLLLVMGYFSPLPAKNITQN